MAAEVGEKRDAILYDAAQRIIDRNPHQDLASGGIPLRVVMIIEYHDADGKPFVRAIATQSCEWWHSLGLMASAERLLAPGYEDETYNVED